MSTYIKKEIVIPEKYHEVKEALAFARGWMRGRVESIDCQRYPERYHEMLDTIVQLEKVEPCGKCHGVGKILMYAGSTPSLPYRQVFFDSCDACGGSGKKKE